MPTDSNPCALILTASISHSNKSMFCLWPDYPLREVDGVALLHQAANLTSFTLGNFFTSDILDEGIWHQLHYLKLEGVYATASDLTNLLGKTTNLVKLHLCNLYGGAEADYTSGAPADNPVIMHRLRFLSIQYAQKNSDDVDPSRLQVVQASLPHLSAPHLETLQLVSIWDTRTHPSAPI
ncbi:hypothetical protein BDV98DRAFT_589188 [Pterulicium gracile]|uniref:F-box domain-containing protein n=1 Tax=Pterulicium gracile TaxID=1884261 RepID=A0A5C3QW10_9AGAR|nr:hypothetical protein BDV98DRAFT_589188 [Pterula gracilis]